eukprot:5062762-Alexandrium_andersonii.AAC.1
MRRPGIRSSGCWRRKLRRRLLEPLSAAGQSGRALRRRSCSTADPSSSATPSQLGQRRVASACAAPQWRPPGRM